MLNVCVWVCVSVGLFVRVFNARKTLHISSKKLQYFFLFLLKKKYWLWTILLHFNYSDPWNLRFWPDSYTNHHPFTRKQYWSYIHIQIWIIHVHVYVYVDLNVRTSAAAEDNQTISTRASFNAVLSTDCTTQRPRTQSWIWGDWNEQDQSWCTVSNGRLSQQITYSLQKSGRYQIY